MWKTNLCLNDLGNSRLLDLKWTYIVWKSFLLQQVYLARKYFYKEEHYTNRANVGSFCFYTIKMVVVFLNYNLLLQSSHVRWLLLFSGRWSVPVSRTHSPMSLCSPPIVPCTPSTWRAQIWRYGQCTAVLWPRNIVFR